MALNEPCVVVAPGWPETWLRVLVSCRTAHVEQRIETGRRRDAALDCFVDGASDIRLVAARASPAAQIVPGSSTRKTLFAS